MVLMVTVPPLASNAMLLESFRDTVTVAVAVPLASILIGLAVINELTALAVGAINATVALCVAADPLIVNDTVAVVGVVLLVNVAV